ncbi:MAG: hypothetical protein KJ950_05960, partial [Proteobacteria bacterium]|nr:hypothetical protein [Pseudomonadota bacterium]MBU1688729.1 hypothetical protein [Pseudomonadota bacterium]
PTATLFAVRGIGSQITKLTSLMLRGRCLNVPSFLEDIPPLICEFALIGVAMVGIIMIRGKA